MSLPPAKKIPKTKADPLVAAAQVPKTQAANPWDDAIAALEARIDKMGGWAATKQDEISELKKLDGKIAELRMTLTASLYDPTALTELTESIKANEAIIGAFAGRKYDALEGKLERDEKRMGLVAQAEDVERPLRTAIRTATYTENDKLKNTYSNDPARADELSDRLAASDDYQVIAAELDKLDMADAFMRSDLENLEGERKAASRLLYSQGLRLQNLTARLLNPTPLGGNDD